MNAFKGIQREYQLKKDDIEERLREFKQIWFEGNDEDVFLELAFCILTPQSKAKICWNSILNLKESGLLLKGDTPTNRKWQNYHKESSKGL
jgi:N-glycosylase/DNA lyase